MTTLQGAGGMDESARLERVHEFDPARAYGRVRVGEGAAAAAVVAARENGVPHVAFRSSRNSIRRRGSSDGA